MSGTALTQRHRDTECRKFVDSGVAWIGQVPEGWKVLPLYSAVAQVKNVNADNHERNLLSLSYGHIKRKNIETMTGLVPASYAGYNIIDAGDIVLRLTDLQNDQKSIRVGLSRERGIVTSAYVTIRPNNQISPDFLACSMLAFDAAKGFYGIGSGVRQGLTYDEVKRLKFQFPPLPIQRAIASFLDRECGKIDALRGKIETQIEKLDELKKSIITEAIDNHRWPMSKVKFIAEINNGSDPRTEGDIPVYGSGESSFKTCGEFKVGPTVLIGRKGATLHIPHYIQGKYWNVDTAFDVTMIGGNNLRWFYYLATVFDYRYYISQTTLPGMSQSNYYNMPIRLPPLAEQREIVEYLDRKCGAIDAAKGKCRAELEKLSEYKKSLIYECVTGKREVA